MLAFDRTPPVTPTTRFTVIHLVFASELDQLAAALARDVARFRAADPARLFAPLPVCVGDRVIARYLDLAIARAGRVSVNLRYPFLNNLLAECLPAEARARLLDRRRLAARLAGVLGDADLLAAPELAPVCRYLAGDHSGRRRAELALELGRLLADYSLTRPAAIARWRDNEEGFGGAPALEAWQRRLFRAVDGATLPQLYAAARDDELDPPAAIFAVGLARFSAGQRLALERLGRVCPVYLYAFNPCEEFWEDVSRPNADNTAADVDELECLPLAYWGRAGRAPVRQLTELARFDFEPRYAPVDDSTALGRLRADVQARRAPAPRPPLSGDRSIEIASCPSVRRELEHVAESIWTLIRSRRDLSWTDIGVLLAGADRDLYRAQIGAVFAEIGDIPHHLTDVPLVEESRVAEAASWLFELAGTRFERPAMLRVITHPRIAGAEIDSDSDIDPADWVSWVDELGVFFGAGPEDHAGTYLPGDVFHWDQALLRLALGTCMEDDPDERPVPAGTREVLPLAVSGDRRRSAGRLALLARSLIADCQWLVSRSLPLGEWGRIFARLVNRYIQPASDREQVELGRCRDTLAELGAHTDPATAPAVPFPVARELARAALAELRTRRGEPLVDGVAIMPLSASALVRFRVAFITGLAEGSFPSASADSPLDLRAHSRQAGEPTSRDRDRYSFLQALHAAPELRLSYVGRDAQTGERLGPSSVISELRQLISAELEHPLVELDIPPHAHDDPGVEARRVHLTARRRRRAAQLRRPGGSAGLTRRLAIERLRATLDPRARALIGLVAPGGETAEPPPIRDVSTAALARFLESPVDAWLSVAVGVRAAELPDINAASEPLDLSPLAETLVARGAVCELAIARTRGAARGTADELEAAIEARVARMIRRGTGPAGVIANFHAERAAALARAWWAGLERAGTGGVTSFAVGRARESDEVGELLDPVVVDLDDAGEASVEIHGGVALAGAGAGELIYFDRHRKVGRRRVLRGLVDHLLLAAAGRIDRPVAAITTIGPEEVRRVELDPLAPEAARAQLAVIAGDLFGGVHDYLLPGDAILEAYLEGRELPIALRRAGDRLPPWAPDWRERGDFDVPEDAGALAARRLGAVLERVRSRRGRG